MTCDKGGEPVGPLVTGDANPDSNDVDLPGDLDTVQWEAGQMHIIADPSRLRAIYGDTADITVIAYDNNHNPISGKQVAFRSNIGRIIPALATTDAGGSASAKFISVPVNTEALIIANLYLTPDSIVQTTTNITLAGLEVNVRPSATHVLLNNVVPVEIEVVDGAGKPLPNDSLFISVDSGDIRDSVRSDVRDTLVTLGSGLASLSVTRADTGSMTVIASSRKGASDTATVHFWTAIPESTVETQDQIRQMRIYTSRSQLNADNTDFAYVTVILINENNNPAEGDTVRFSSDLGVIDKLAVVDSSGRATVRLQSSPINGVCTIRAVASSTKDTVSTQILFGGISLQLTTDPAFLKIGEYADVQALLRNASGMPIGGDLVTFTVSGGALFASGATLEKVVLDPEGKAVIRVTSAAACSALIHATTLNTRDSTTVVFTNNALSILSILPSSIRVGGSDSAVITVKYVNGSNQPVMGVPILFAANAGTIRAARDTTNFIGIATAVLVSADFATTATVQAVAPDAAVSGTVTFTASAPASISLTVTPDNIQVNGGVATLIAIVLDAQGNRVSGSEVNFKIIEGPGGGEAIDKPLVTLKDGEARAQILSGSVPSQLLGTKIEASVGSFADTTKLTISGQPYAVSVARPQSDTIRVEDAGQIDSAVFDYFMGAVVKDINGNPVADGTEVHFSAVICGMAVYIKTFDHWAGVGSTTDEIKAVYTYPRLMIPFEDLNNNLFMDPGIDLKLDFNDAVASRGDDVNGDGTCDYSPLMWDFWWDFNGNGVCDPGVGETYYVDPMGVTDSSIYQDLNGNGARDSTELLVDHNGNGVCDLPPSGDFRFSMWEGLTALFSRNFRFDDNSFSVIINNSAVTKGGVAYARLTYPRNFARKLFVLVDAECQGIRDIHTEPFVLVVIVKN